MASLRCVSFERRKIPSTSTETNRHVHNPINQTTITNLECPPPPRPNPHSQCGQTCQSKGLPLFSLSGKRWADSALVASGASSVLSSGHACVQTGGAGAGEGSTGMVSLLPFMPHPLLQIDPCRHIRPLAVTPNRAMVVVSSSHTAAPATNPRLPPKPRLPGHPATLRCSSQCRIFATPTAICDRKVAPRVSLRYIPMAFHHRQRGGVYLC